MVTSDGIKVGFRFLGFHDDDKGMPLRPVIMTVLATIFGVNALAFMAKISTSGDLNENTLVEFAFGFRDFVHIFCHSGLVVVYYATKDRLNKVLGLIDKSEPVFSEELSEDQKDCIFTSKKLQRNTLRGIIFFITIAFGLVLLFPGIEARYQISQRGVYLNPSELSLPIKGRYPENNDSFLIYAAVYAVQTVYLFYICAVPYIAVSLIICVSQAIAMDERLWLMELLKMDKVLSVNVDEYDSKLRDYTRRLINWHLDLIKSVNTVNVCLRWNLIIANRFVCLFAGTSLFCAAEVEDKLLQIFNFACLFAGMSMVFLYNYFGQHVVNGGEDITEALYDCEWLNKPDWFKKDLRLILRMAQEPLCIRPFRLFDIRISTFVNILNVAYSYFCVFKALQK